MQANSTKLAWIPTSYPFSERVILFRKKLQIGGVETMSLLPYSVHSAISIESQNDNSKTNKQYCQHPLTNRSFKTLRTILSISSIAQAYSLELRTHVLTDASVLNLTGTDNTTVDSARHAVLLLDVQLGESVLYAISSPFTKFYVHRQKHHEYLSGTRHRQCFSPGNASRPYPKPITQKQQQLTFPTQRPQWVQRTGFTWPLPFFERPWFLESH